MLTGRQSVVSTLLQGRVRILPLLDDVSFVNLQTATVPARLAEPSGVLVRAPTNGGRYCLADVAVGLF